MTDEEVDDIVDMLGTVLTKVKKDLANKTGIYIYIYIIQWRGGGGKRT